MHFLYYFRPVSEVHDIRKTSHVVYSDITHYRQEKEIYHAVSYDVSEDYIKAMEKKKKKYIRYKDSIKIF